MKQGVEGALCAMTEESKIGSITYAFTSQSEDWTWLVSGSHSYSENISRAKEHSLTEEFGLLPDVKSIWKGANGSQYVEACHDILCGLCKREKEKRLHCGIHIFPYMLLMCSETICLMPEWDSSRCIRGREGERRGGRE